MAIAVRWLTVCCVLTVSFWQGTLTPVPVLAQTPPTQNDPTPTRPLKVGVRVLPPFVIGRPLESPSPNPQSQGPKQTLDFVGIDIALWEAIATGQKWRYDYVIYETVETGLADLQKGQLDILLGGLEITPERLNQVSFSQPYYFSHGALLVRRPPLPFWNYLHPFLRIAALTAIATIFLLISLFAHLIWLAERGANPDHFPPDYWDGMRQAYWFTAVTMTTVGYGDTVPITSLGRRLTFVWMWVGMVLSSSITAALASGFTLSVTQQLETGTLQTHNTDQQIAVVGDALNFTFLNDAAIPLTEVNSLEDALDLLDRDQVRGILYFDDSLAYVQRTQPEKHYQLLDLDAVAIAYGFALRLDDPLLQPINIDLMELLRDGQLRSIINRYSPPSHD